MVVNARERSKISFEQSRKPFKLITLLGSELNIQVYIVREGSNKIWFT
jgi:hypothetical protein